MSTSSRRLTPARTSDRGFDPDGAEGASHVAEQQAAAGLASRMALVIAAVTLALAGATAVPDLPASAVGAPATVGSPGGDGQDATCRADTRTEPSDCDAVGEDGADGADLQ
jgi:hypothetical protein